MKIIVHRPKTLEARQELSNRVAEVHARAVVNKINSLPLEKEQQDLLLSDLKMP